MHGKVDGLSPPEAFVGQFEMPLGLDFFSARDRRWFLVEQLRVANPQAIKPVLAHRPQSRQSIASAALEMDAAGLGKVADGNGNIAEPEAEPHRLNEKLRVKDKVIRIVPEGNALQHFPPINA